MLNRTIELVQIVIDMIITVLKEIIIFILAKKGLLIGGNKLTFNNFHPHMTACLP